MLNLAELGCTSIKTFFQKQSPNKYQSYKNSSNDTFRYDLTNELFTNEIEEGNLVALLEIYTKPVDSHAHPDNKKTHQSELSPYSD